MTDTVERIGAVCPSCSPELETVHEVLKPDGQATVRCTECDHVHKTRIETPDTTALDVVVSQDGDSFSATTDAPADETIAVGEEFVLETDEGIFTVRITSLELEGDRRADSAPADDVETAWTRAVGNVAVPVTIHPHEGTGDREDSYSTKVYVPGDYRFVVGESETFGDEEFSVEGLHIRDDAVGYDFAKLDHDGDEAIAKDLKRVYARDETTTAWSAW